MAKTLIKGGWVVSLDKKIGELKKGDVLIDGDKIEKIGKSIRVPGAKVIDASNRIVMPGFVNAHLHTWQTGIRGIAGNWSIPEYLHAMHAGIAPKFTAKDTYIANLVGALNQIDLGVTTIFDWCHNNATPAHSDAALDGLEESGIRAVFGHGSPKPDAKKGQKPFPEIPHPRAEVERFRRGRLSDDDGRITFAMAILGPDFSVWEVCEHDFRLAREFGVISSAHVWGAPNRLNPDGYKKLAKLGLLGKDHNAVHCNYLKDAELKLLVDQGCSITVTPEVELQMGHGVPVTGRVRAFGGTPSLGVDVESNISGDMFTVMRMALQPLRQLENFDTMKATRQSAQKLSVTPEETLRWATIDAAKACGLDTRTGSLKPGKQADIVLLRTDDLNVFPVHNAVETIVFQANGSNVDTVMVAGKILKQNGKLKFRGLDKKMAELQRSGRRILKGTGHSMAA